MSDGLRPILDDLAIYLKQQATAGVAAMRVDEDRVRRATESAPQRVAATEPTPVEATADNTTRLAQLDASSVANCSKCELHASRTNTVFGVGNPNASILIIGEAPGRDEDLQGEPFVGAAGQLLNKILSAIGFAREDVYIANILKCRPPDNRDPKPEEVAACVPNLLSQLDIIAPKIILALGRVAAQNLLDTEQTLGKMRQNVHEYHGIPTIVTYHPAALLRNEKWKKPTWEDVQKLRDLHSQLNAEG